MNTLEAAAQISLACADLDAAIALYTGELGFRLDMIMPADAPRVAVVSGHGIAVRLEGPAAPVAVDAPVFAISRAAERGAWSAGRAGMLYRDLIPGRLGGRFIASHIRIQGGGEVADYPHYHNVRFQMIYCRRGWVRVVYEDQGPPFTMHEGDCVLQPPLIRHRVLESSAGLEVIEIGSPAEHETFRDHAIALPTARVRPERDFDGQRFVRHVAADGVWQRGEAGGFDVRDCGIADATAGFASARVLRARSHAATPMRVHGGECLFFAVLEGRLTLRSKAMGDQIFGVDDACAIPTGGDYAISTEGPCEVLQVSVPG